MTGDFADDADLTHPWAARYRIPVVRTTHPSWRYEVALTVPGDTVPGEDDLLPLTWPSEDEARLIANYIDFRRGWYREGWAAKMLERPLDVDSGTNTVILARREDSWSYRLASYTVGPLLYPLSMDLAISVGWPVPQLFPTTPAGLLALLDKINENSVRWDAWKGEHRDLLVELGAEPAEVAVPAVAE